VFSVGSARLWRAGFARPAKTIQETDFESLDSGESQWNEFFGGTPKKARGTRALPTLNRYGSLCHPITRF